MASLFCFRRHVGAMLIWSLLILTLGSNLTFGQTTNTTGSLSGAVSDTTSAFVPGATVTIKNKDTGAERVTTTNDQGEFVFPQVAPGKYSVAVEAKGFRRTMITEVVVEVGIPARTSVTLEVGDVSESVTVVASQAVVNVSTATLSNVINTRQVQDLPLPTRNPLDLAGLQPGVAVVGDNTRGSSISGLRQTSTNVTQDGINAMDNFVKTSSLFAVSAPSLNSTSEFSITTGSVDASAGRGVAQVNLVTRGGANDFHGDVFYLNRNDYTQANSFFNNLTNTRRERQNQHFFGVAVGGPVIAPRLGEGGKALWNGRDRAFWFFSYEGFRENFAVTRNRTVLTPEARNGTFRYTGANGATTSVNLLTIGNANALNPVTAVQLNAMPLPNNNLVGDTFNTAGFRFNVLGKNVNDKVVMRYDHTLVEKSQLGSHRLEFVFNRAAFSTSPDTLNNIEAPFPGGVDANQVSTRWLLTAALHSTFGNVTNELRWGRQWAPVEFLRAAPPPNPFHLTLVSVTNFDNTFMSQGRNTTVTQLIDNMSVPKGSHIFRFGGDYQQVFIDQFNDAGTHQTINLSGSSAANPTGITTSDFTNLPAGSTGNAIVTRAQNVFADITGFLGTTTRTFNVTSPTSGFVTGATRSRITRQRDLAFYVQDQWRARPNLTLNMGLRWDYEGVPTVPNGLAIQVTNFNDLFGISGPGNLFNPNAPAGAAPAKATIDLVSGDTGKGLYNNDWNNFAPSFGFAWSPDFKKGFFANLFGPTGTSSIRGNFSISYLYDGGTVVSNVLGVGTTNPGLIQAATNTTLSGVLTSSGVSLTTPTFALPTTDRQNFLVNPGNGTTTIGNGLWAFDPNLRIPYVQQWSIGYEREIARNTAFEIRYVGNHAVKVWRSFDVNEINIFENGFLREFKNAQANLAARGGSGFAPPGIGAACATCVALPILSALFTQAGLSPGQTTAGQFSNTAFISNLNNNNIATMAATLAYSSVYRLNRENPALGLAANFFVANPNAAFSRFLTNDSMSNYHALQAEVRRRFSNGFQFQADYTFSKSLTDARDAIGNNQSDLNSFRTLRDKGLDYARSNQDQTHRFIFNGIYDLPFGNGRRFFRGANGVTDRIIGGWTTGVIWAWQSRPPIYVASGRSSFNNFNAVNNPADLVGITLEELKKNLGIFRHPTGVYFINPDLLDITTVNGQFVSSTAKAGLFAVPAPGTFGNFPINSLNGPRYFNIDASLVKRVAITEGVKAELKTTFINILNNPNFVYNTQNFDSTSFGRINATSGSPRVIHFTMKVTF